MIVENNTFVDNKVGAILSGSTLPGDDIWAPGRAANEILRWNRGTGIKSQPSPVSRLVATP